MYAKSLKKPIDSCLALLALLVLAPLILLVAILVRLKLGSPVIFKQKRPGKNEKIFTIYKFRSMTDERDDEGILLLDKYRLTNFGKFLRSTSLDELPSLINIVKGELAIVGPRPLAISYLPYYNEEERLRHAVLPGLTGLAQVNGRNATTWEERFAHDLEYVNNITFLGDIKIILLTLKIVLCRSGIGVRGVDSPIDFDVYRMNQNNNGT